MVCISVFYPNGPNKRFDHDYYLATHMPLVRDCCRSFGLIRYEVDRGVSGGTPGSQAPFVAVGRLYFSAVSEFVKALEAHGAEIMGDIPNYTDIEPQIQVSELTES
jgi:uncharacterized protein (TIGR02118 family)